MKLKCECCNHAVVDMRDVVWRKSVGSINTDGVCLKAEIDGNYLKLSGYDVQRGIYGMESLHEYIAMRVGQVLDFNVPDGNIKRALVCVEGEDYETVVFTSFTYKKPGYSRVAFEDYYAAYRTSNRETALDFCKRFGWADYIYKMFVFDYLIINRDRHGANLEVFKNEKAFLSPFFDNGLSFCLDAVTGFDPLLPRKVNNFIGKKGEQGLEENLSEINKRLDFNRLRPEHFNEIFSGVDEYIEAHHQNKIWEILLGRWENVKDFCDA